MTYLHVVGGRTNGEEGEEVGVEEDRGGKENSGKERRDVCYYK